MKKDLLTVKELTAELRMSSKSIQRAYRKEEIPVQWLGRMWRRKGTGYFSGRVRGEKTGIFYFSRLE